MKVFLSHKMHGITEEEAMAIRNKALAYLKKHYGEDIELIDNYHHENVPEGAGRLWHLGTSIRMMEQADAVFFCDQGSMARGCKVELRICELYEIRVLNDELPLSWYLEKEEG